MVATIRAMHMVVVLRMIVTVRVIMAAARTVQMNVIVSVIVTMRMRVIVTAARTMNMPVVVIMVMTVMLVKHALCEFEVFGVSRVVTVLVTSTVSAGFRLEGHQCFGDVDIEPQ